MYSQSGSLYKIFPNALRSQIDPTKLKLGPHADGVVGLLDSNTISLLVNQLQKMSLQSALATQVMSYVSPPSQPSMVNLV